MQSVPGDKPFFAPVPIAAISDRRLTETDLRTLMCVCWHDRMSASPTSKGNGQGGWASNRTMALRAGCDHTSLSSSITRLAKLGYITREQHHFDKRKHVYRVIYETVDRFSPRKAPGLPADQASTPAASAPPAADHFPNENASAEIVSGVLEESQQSQDDVAGKYIPLSGERYSVETEEINSSQEAQNENDAVHLARIERALKAGLKTFSTAAWLTWLNSVVESEPENNIRSWAIRLADELYDTLADADQIALDQPGWSG